MHEVRMRCPRSECDAQSPNATYKVQIQCIRFEYNAQGLNAMHEVRMRCTKSEHDARNPNTMHKVRIWCTRFECDAWDPNAMHKARMRSTKSECDALGPNAMYEVRMWCTRSECNARSECDDQSQYVMQLANSRPHDFHSHNKILQFCINSAHLYSSDSKSIFFLKQHRTALLVQWKKIASNFVHQIINYFWNKHKCLPMEASLFAGCLCVDHLNCFWNIPFDWTRPYFKWWENCCSIVKTIEMLQKRSINPVIRINDSIWRDVGLALSTLYWTFTRRKCS